MHRIAPQSMQSLMLTMRFNGVDLARGTGFLVKTTTGLALITKAEWEHINLDAAERRFHVTKTNTEHIVPLSRQAVAALTEVRRSLAMAGMFSLAHAAVTGR